MKKTILFLALALHSGLVSADNMFRCTDSDFVHNGDSSTTVMMKCGAHVMKDESTGGGAKYKEEAWIYRHPNDNDRATAFYFKRGKIVKIEGLGRID